MPACVRAGSLPEDRSDSSLDQLAAHDAGARFIGILDRGNVAQIGRSGVGLVHNQVAQGADPERVAWAIAMARRAREDAGLDPDAISLGAWVNVAAHPDTDTARGLVSGSLATFARFNAMHGSSSGPLSASGGRRSSPGALRPPSEAWQVLCFSSIAS